MNAFHANRIRLEILVIVLLAAGVIGCDPSARASKASNTVDQTPQAVVQHTAHPVRVLVPQGTEMQVRLSTAVGSETSQIGDSITATTMAAVVVGSQVAVPTGSTLHGRVTNVVAGTKGLKISEKGGVVVVSLDTLTTPDGSTTPIYASISEIAGSKGKTAGIIGGSAAGGALLGKILGGDTEDAAVGAILGGAIGTGIAAGTKGKELQIPAGTELTMVLDQALSIG